MLVFVTLLVVFLRVMVAVELTSNSLLTYHLQLLNLFLFYECFQTARADGFAHGSSIYKNSGLL